MLAALILAVGLMLAAGIVLAGAPLLSGRFRMHPISAAQVALGLAGTVVGAACLGAFVLMLRPTL